jgi:hypothetical protein
MKKKISNLIYDKWGEFRSWVFVVFAVMGLAGICIIIIIPAYLLDKKSCTEVSKKLNLESDHSFFTGCMIEDSEGIWWPEDAIRANGEFAR